MKFHTPRRFPPKILETAENQIQKGSIVSVLLCIFSVKVTCDFLNSQWNTQKFIMTLDFKIHGINTMIHCLIFVFSNGIFFNTSITHYKFQTAVPIYYHQYLPQMLSTKNLPAGYILVHSSDSKLAFWYTTILELSGL